MDIGQFFGILFPETKPEQFLASFPFFLFLWRIAHHDNTQPGSLMTFYPALKSFNEIRLQEPDILIRFFLTENGHPAKTPSN